MAVSPADVEYGLSLLKARQERDRKFASYYSGQFPLSFVSHNFRQAFGSWLRNVGYNRSRNVVDAFADRTSITGWDLPNGSEELTALAQDIWLRNQMDHRQNELWKEAYRSGDAYVVVWPDEETGQARMFVNRAHCMTVVYDEEYPDHIDYAVKCWPVERGPNKGKWRVTVYDAEMVARYVTTSKSDAMPAKFERLVPYQDDGQPEVVNLIGEVPVVHFGNDADTGGFGTSELSDVVPLQDGANKAIADQLVASEFVAYPQRYAIGIDEPEKDSNGNEINPFKPGMSRLWTVSGSEQGDQPVQFGQFTPADMTQFIAVQDAWDMKIGRVSRVPVSWLNQSASNTSGETKKMDEAPFVSKIIDRQGSFTDPASRVQYLAMKIEGAGDEAAGIKPVWLPAESRSEREMYEIAQFQKALGFPDEQIWTELGKSADEIAEMTRQKTKAANDAAIRFATSFDRGSALPGDQQGGGQT